jgi:hypothetical protein
MPTKEKKTASELQELIFVEFRKRPELNNVQTISVTPVAAPAPDGPSWECHRVSDGPATLRVTVADEIIRKLQDQFDLL